MLEALIQPTTFFRALQERRPSLIVPLLIVMAAAVAAALGNVLLLRLLPTLIPGGLLLQVVFAVVGGVVLGILLIGLGGLIIHLLAGPESRAWEVYGWANVPALLLGLVMIPFQAMFPITGNLPPPRPTCHQPRGPAGLAASLPAGSSSRRGNPYFAGLGSSGHALVDLDYLVGP